MIRIKLVILTILCALTYNNSYSQGTVIDDFSKKAMPDWIWGGVEMKYSHQEDNKENGFADIFSKDEINSGAFIGKIVFKNPHSFTAGNYIDIMLKGAKNDVNIVIKVIYDIDGNNLFDAKKDFLLISKPISIDFDGWKEVKIKFDQENFRLSSDMFDNFEVTEENVYGIQIDFEAGKNYVKSKFESGIALISEIPNKEALTENDGDNSTSKESYFSASNSPNPFNPSTTISYTLNQATYVTLAVYDRLGRQVEVLVDQNQESGVHNVDFNASDLPSGIYFYRIKTPEKTEVRKMLFAK